MIGFSQANDLLQMLVPNTKGHTSANFCDEIDEIDEIMKQEREDQNLSLDESLSTTPLDLDLDSISDLLENSRSTSTNFTQSLTLNDLSPTFPPAIINPNSLTNTTATTSAYSSLGNSPKFSSPHLPAYGHQREDSNFTTSRSFEFRNDLNGQLDVKRFRSASMNDGPSLYPQQNKREPQFFDPYRFKTSTYINPPPSYPTEPTSPTDLSTHPNWPFTGCSRPVSNSFSEVENQQQQQRLNPRHPMGFLQTKPFPQQTLYSINQSSNENFTLPTKKRLSLVDFPVPEIKDDPTSPSCTMEQQSEPDLWSDIDQTSSDLFHDNDRTSGSDDDDDDDDDATTSGDYSKTFRSHSSPSRFWKYNVQSKGPKTKRMLYLKERDPHLHREFSDPVYQIKLTQTNGQTCNKLRKGDGNDVTPNPMKLYQLGKQIRDLLKNTSSLYQGIYNVGQPNSTNDTIEAKKEKNKLASKTCRLRKKAQHEANKLKLQGLNEEHKSLIEIIASIKLVILQRYNDDQLKSSSLETALDQLIAKKYNQTVAGNADGFVESTINEIEKLYSQPRS